MESERQKSKHIVRYNFQLFLEDEDEEEEEEDTLLMDSWIDLDLNSDEEALFARACQIADEDQDDEELINITGKLGDEFKLPEAESLPHTSQTLHCNISPEDNQLEDYSSQIGSHFQNSGELKGTNNLITFGVYELEKENTGESPSLNVSKVFSSEPSPGSLCNKTETSKQATDVHSSNVENTAESVLPVEVDSTTDTNETSMHLLDVYSLKVESAFEIPHSRSSVDRVHNLSETCRNSTDPHSVTVENTNEITHTHVSESFLTEAFDSNMCPFIQTESKCHSEGQITLLSSNNHKRSFSDDETVITISDDEDEDCNIVYIGSYQSSDASDANKHEKPSLDKKMKCEHIQRENTAHAIATNDDNDNDIMICEDKGKPEVTAILFIPGKAMKSSETSSSYQDPDVTIEEIVYPTSNPKVNNLLPSKSDSAKYRENRKELHQLPEIPIIDIDSAQNVFDKDVEQRGTYSTDRLHKKYILW